MEKNLETKNVIEYISESCDIEDFQERCNVFFNILVQELGARLNMECRFDFDYKIIIDEIDKDAKKIIKEINNSVIVLNQPLIMETMFIDIIKLNFTRLYDIYSFHDKFINN